MEGSSRITVKKTDLESRIIDLLKFLIFTIIFTALLLLFLRSIVNNIEMTREIDKKLCVLLFLSAIGSTYLFMKLLKLIKAMFDGFIIVYSWVKYKKEYTSDLEVYYYSNYSRLEKEKASTGYDLDGIKVKLEK